MKNPGNTEAVSEILGEILLLAIAVTSISIIYMQVLSTPGPTDTTNVTIIGKIEKGLPVFELQRGESLGLDTKIIITLAGFEEREFLLRDIENQEWDIGERIVLPVNDTTGIQVDAAIVDTKTNSIVFWGSLQKGLSFRYKGGIWHFNETSWSGIRYDVKDSSGNNNHGIALNGAYITTNGISKNAGNFNGFLNIVKVNTSWTLNITNAITVEAWMNPQPRKSVGDIIESLTGFGYTPYVIHASGPIYAVVSEDQGKIGTLSTVNISDLGEIDRIQNVTFGGSTSQKTLRPMISQISEELYLISYNDKDGYIHLRTYFIFNNGSIKYTGNEKICNDYKLAQDPGRPNRPSQLKITENIYAITYWATNNKGILKTLNISSTGAIKYVENMTYEAWYEPCFVHVTGDVYALAYRRNVSNYGIIKTFKINSTGHINPIDEKVYSKTQSAYEPSLIKVSENVFAIAYSVNDSATNKNYGYVTTINISSNGIIYLTNKTVAFEHALNCYNPCLIHAFDNTYIIAYSTADNSGYSMGYIVTLKISKDGSFGSIEPRKAFEIDTGQQTRCFNPIIVRISDYVFVISYEGFGNHPGKLITLIIGKIPRGICKGSSYVLYANTTMVEGCINNFYVSYYNNSLGLTWHHFALTYNGMSVCLYVDGTKVNETGYPYHRIKLTKEPLYFGRYYCGYLDEIAIYDQALTQKQIQFHHDNPGLLESTYI